MMNHASSGMQDLLNGKKILSNKKKYTYVALSVMGVHVCLLCIFIFAKVLPLVFVNIGSVLVYIIMYLLVQRRKYKVAFYMVYFEIFFHTIVATLLLGWELGFPFYNLAMIPVSFYIAYTTPMFKRKIFSPTLLMIGNMVITISVCIISAVEGDMYHVKDGRFIMEVHIFNIIIAFVFLFIFSLFFVIEISRNQAFLVMKNRQLASLANFDPLTKLLNRRSIQPFFREVQSSHEKFCLVLSDIDDFKKVNDTYGHRCGDQVLIHVADLCREALGPEDVVCRWGGEEFLFILGGDQEKCAMLTEKLCSTIANTHYNFEKASIRITMTFGVQEHVPTQLMDETIKQADDKLYEGKRTGKNRVVW